MATIAQKPGLLDIDYIVLGDAFAFQCVFTGDLTADTFTAVVNDADGDVSLSVNQSYSAGTGKTTVTFTLSAANSALLSEGTLSWRADQVSGGVSRNILAGRFVTVAK